MSAELMGAVLYLDLPAQRKLILVAMADNANEAGRCWPSQALIALKASISTRRLRDHLKALEADGWLTVLDSGQGRGNTGQYLLHSDTIHGLGAARRANKGKPDKADAVAQAPDVKGDAVTEKGDVASVKGDAAVLQNPKEPLIEPSVDKGETEPVFSDDDFPPWVRIFLVSPRFKRPSQEWVAEMELEYMGQNLYLAATLCYQWLISSAKGKHRKSWEGTFETWVRTNKADPKRREVAANGELGDGTDSKYAAQKARMG